MRMTWGVHTYTHMLAGTHSRTHNNMREKGGEEGEGREREKEVKRERSKGGERKQQ